MVKRGIYPVAILISSCLVISILLFFYIVIYFPSQTRQLEKNIFDKIRTISLLAEPAMQKAVKAQDDIALLSAIESIMKVEDVASVYALDAGGAVLAHNQIGEWGKRYNDSFSGAGIKAGKAFWQRPAGEIIYSVPLDGHATLFIRLSRQRVAETMNALKKKALITGGAVAVISISLLAFLFHNLVSVPFKKLHGVLSSMILGSGGAVEGAGNGEFGETYRLLNELVGVVNTRAGNVHGGASPEGVSKNYALLLETALEGCSNGLIVISADNMILGINSLARRFLGMDAGYAATGKHVLDAISSPPLTELLQKAVAGSCTVEETVSSHRVRVEAILSPEKQPAGAIITIH